MIMPSLFITEIAALFVFMNHDIIICINTCTCPIRLDDMGIIMLIYSLPPFRSFNGPYNSNYFSERSFTDSDAYDYVDTTDGVSSTVAPFTEARLGELVHHVRVDKEPILVRTCCIILILLALNYLRIYFNFEYSYKTCDQ